MIRLQPVSALAVNGTTLAVVWSAGRQIMIGGMEIGTLTAFITYLTQILTALNFLANIRPSGNAGGGFRPADHRDHGCKGGSD